MANKAGQGQSVKFPVAELDGNLVWATDAALDDPRPTGMVCVGCEAPIVLRAGSRNRPHFAHKAGSDCGAGETVLHRTASAMSRRAGGVYLAHHCRKGHLQGDNFIYGNEGVLDLDGTVQHMVVCQSGHWQDIGGPRSWPARTRASRVLPVVGLVGNPTDLFDSSDNDHDDPSFHPARVTPDNMRRLINRAVYGSRSY